jgi:hypothetical protein
LPLQDSKDVIEQLYGDIILSHFPNYEVFWRQFIGNPNADEPKAYEYKFPAEMSPEEKESIKGKYEKIRVTHYSLFCELAGAHFQLQEMKNSEKLENLKDKYFRHWEHFEAGYLHLGSIFYMLDELWNIVLKLTRAGNKKLNVAFLVSEGKQELADSLKNTEETVKTLRDLVVHRGRAFTSFTHKGKFYIPIKVSREMNWSTSIKCNENIETTQKLQEDIDATERLLNDLHDFLISEYENFLKTKNVQIDYGVVK